jgi:hypothetical protein
MTENIKELPLKIAAASWAGTAFLTLLFYRHDLVCE